jgi:hypothetical protein
MKLKLYKSILVPMFIALISGTFLVKAQEVQSYPPLPFPVTNQFETLNFNLTATKQGIIGLPVSATVTATEVTTSKINNQGLLAFLASAFNTNWPTGAKLALDIQSLNIFVVDKTGTNPIFNASTGVNDVANTNVAYFSFNTGSPVFSNRKDTNGRVLQETDHKMVVFHLFNERNGTNDTDIYLSGLATTGFRTITANSATQSEEALIYGQGIFQNETWTVMSGNVTGTGTWRSSQ